jgi:hypothetical protein
MRRTVCLVAIFAGAPLGLSAGETPPKKEYTEISGLIHKIVVKQLPKEFEDASAWGQTIPAPPNMPFAFLRKYVKVGDKREVPHGAWLRFKGKIENPGKDLKIAVKDFEKIDDKTYRIALDVEAKVLCQVEWQQWQKGLLLFGTNAAGDADLKAALVCDVGVSLNLTKLPPALNIEPKVSELGLDLVDFNFRDPPEFLKGEKALALGNDLKDLARAAIKSSEPFVKELANQAIAQSLQENKGTISAGAILKALPKYHPGKKVDQSRDR